MVGGEAVSLLRAFRARLAFMRGARYAVVFLFLLSVALATFSLLWTSGEVNSTSQRFAAAQAVQRRGEVIAQQEQQKAETTALARAIAASDRQWCTALVILTRFPAPRPPRRHATAVARASYDFYLSLVRLEHRFGCGDRQ